MSICCPICGEFSLESDLKAHIGDRHLSVQNIGGENSLTSFTSFHLEKRIEFLAVARSLATLLVCIGSQHPKAVGKVIGNFQKPKENQAHGSMTKVRIKLEETGDRPCSSINPLILPQASTATKFELADDAAVITVSSSDDEDSDRASTGFEFFADSPSSLRPEPSDTLGEILSPQQKRTCRRPSDNHKEEERLCFCRQGCYEKMIACDSPNCLIQWFHFECVKITEAPSGNWFCPLCAKKHARPKSKSSEKKPKSEEQLPEPICTKCKWTSTGRNIIQLRESIQAHVWQHLPADVTAFRCLHCPIASDSETGCAQFIRQRILKVHLKLDHRISSPLEDVDYSDLRGIYANEFQRQWTQCFPEVNEVSFMGAESIEEIRRRFEVQNEQEKRVWSGPNSSEPTIDQD